MIAAVSAAVVFATLLTTARAHSTTEPVQVRQRWVLEFETYESMISSVTSPDGVTVFTHGCLNLTAVNVATGTRQWGFNANAMFSVATTPVLSLDSATVFVGSANNLTAVDATTGTLRWVLNVSIPACPWDIHANTPALSPDGATLFVTVADSDSECRYNHDNLYAVDAATGTPKWHSDLLGLSTVSTPVISPDGAMVLMTEGGGEVVAVDAATGTQKWHLVAENGGWPLRDVSTFGAVAISQDGVTLFVGADSYGPGEGYTGYLFAIDAASGTLKWAFTSDSGGLGDSHPVLSLDGATVFMGSASSGLHAVDAVTGTQQWVFRNASRTSSPTLSSDGATVFVEACPVDAFDDLKDGYQGCYLHAVDAATGTEKWAFHLLAGDPYCVSMSQPALSPDGATVFVGADTYFYAVHTGSLSPTHSPTTSAPTTSTPTVSPTTSTPTVSPTTPPTLAPTTSTPTVSPTSSPTTSSPTTSPTLDSCTPIKPSTAAWAAVTTVGPLAGHASYRIGVDHAYPKRLTAAWTAAWNAAATAAVRAGFSFTGAYSVGVAAAGTGPLATIFRAAVDNGTATTVTRTFEPGVVWQLQLAISDQCGTSTVFTGELGLIQSASESFPPCCLPGRFADPTQAHGACSVGDDGQTYNVCAPHPTKVPTKAPTSTPATTTATDDTLLYIEVAGGTVAGLVLLAAVFFYVRRKPGNAYTANSGSGAGDDDSELISICNASPLSTHGSPRSPPVGYVDPVIYTDIGDLTACVAQHAPAIRRSDLRLGTEQLGKGEFGVVRRGLLANHYDEPPAAVACKMLQAGGDEQKFLAEAVLMAQFRHPNVIALIGVVHGETTGTFFKTVRPMIIVSELAEHGELRRLLVRGGIDLPTLIGFGIGVAEGMAYLAGKGYVHRDLAARNVLVCGDGVCKIADFGMSRGLDDDSEYFRNAEGGKVPTRWTAPEALTSRKYTTSSDVWSFGVLLWEVMSQGELPYSELKVNSQVIAAVTQGHRLPLPARCPQSVYAVMQQCWAENRRERITFPMIVVALNNALTEFL